MNANRKKDFLLSAAFWSVILLLAYWGFQFALRLFWPFLSGLFLAFLLHPAVNWISRFSSAKKSFWSVAILLLVYLAFGLVLWFVCCLALSSIQNLMEFLPRAYQEHIEPFLILICEHFYPPGAKAAAAAENAGQLMEQIQKTILEYSSKAIALISGWIAKAPAVFTAFLFAVLSSFMISMEYQNISLWIQRNTPRRVHRILMDLKEFIFSTLLQMLKAYAILFLITFLELMMGLFLLKVENFWSMALLIAAADALPVVGPGIVLVPWSAACFVSGSYFRGIGLLALYGIVALVRTVIEPKILGKQFGLHPLATITAMYAGAQLWGIGGFLLAPAAVLYFLHWKEKQNWNFSFRNLF
ncbi:MAG: sporulation integral membrane protein YtvI [Oscillospiraceae bacterium]|nr:sporulation integral membrane protein YtvI [Oscillospiraceae bacterium]